MSVDLQVILFSLCRVCFAICFLKGDCEKDILIIVTTKKSIPTNLKFAEATPAYHAEPDILEPSGDVCQRLNHLVSLNVLCCLNFAEKSKSEDNTPKCIENSKSKTDWCPLHHKMN